MSLGSYEEATGVLRIDDDGCDLLGVAQSAITLTQMLPGPAGIGGFVDAIADRKVRSPQSFAAADIDNVGIRWRHRQCANRAGRLAIKDWLPCSSEVRCFPDAAITWRHVEDILMAGNAGDGPRASPTERADHAPAHFLVHGRVIPLCRYRRS